MSDRSPHLEPEAVARFSDEARKAVYEAIALRRDVRHFVADRDVDEETVQRILGAAHLAPSVGFSQPWGFVVVRDRARRERIRESFLRCREAESARYPPDRRERYLSYRLEGLLGAPVNVCVAVDLRPRPEAILGTTVQPEAVRASACCAVQNLWLAARAEGIGVGWVSIVEPYVLRRELALPPGVEPIAYLCVGHPVAFRGRPMLEELGWQPRRVLADAVHMERWRPNGEIEQEDRKGGRFEEENQKTFRSSDLPVHSLSDAPDAAVLEAAREHQALLTKPVGSLGRLEEVAAWYAAARGEFPVAPPEHRALALFMADHGVVAEGVSAYGSQVTAAMACNVMAGGAAVSVLARRSGVDLVAVDVGIAGDTSAAPVRPLVSLVRGRVAAGTNNLRIERAMSVAQVSEAMEVGRRVADDVFARGARLAGVGEIGIGNTTSAAALVSVFAGAPPEETCGRGTGFDDATRARKVLVVRDALARHGVSPEVPLEALAAVGGLEIAAMVGFLLRCAALRLPVVLDGFVTNAAALVARALDPAVTSRLLASHASPEPGARIALERLGLSPLLSLGMRLGEGTGALLAMDLVCSAVALQAEMATFATAGIAKHLEDS
jgi:nicotinate-nucleotide--dimethylbenzimidazole phosphoribosyltransferase